MEPHDPFGKLGALQREMIAQKDEQTNAEKRIGNRIRARIGGPGRSVPAIRQQAILWADAASCVLGLGVFAFQQLTSSSPVLPSEREWIMTASQSPSMVVLPDLSEVTFQPTASGRIHSINNSDVRVVLKNGTAKLSVAPVKKGIWRVEAGPFAVFVTGTEFDVSWDSNTGEFALRLYEGTVNVTGPMLYEGKTLTEDQQLLVSTKDARLEISPLDFEMLYSDDNCVNGDNHSSKRDSSVERSSRAMKKQKMHGRTEATPDSHATVVIDAEKDNASKSNAALDWVSLNREGKFQEVLQRANAIGIRQVLDTRSLPEVMALGDAARLSRNKAVAEEAYRVIRVRFQGTLQASNAAFYLGNMAFNQRRAYSVAQKWLELYLAEQRNGALCREALGMLITAQRRTGETARAKISATEYLAKYPNGPHASAAASVLEEN